MTATRAWIALLWVQLISGGERCDALFEGSKVRILNAQQFNKLKAEGTPFIVKFFSSRCGHCTSFAPEYEKVAAALRDIMDVVAVEDASVMQSERITGYPTVKFIGANGTAEFQEQRTAEKVADFALAQLRKHVHKLLMTPKGKPTTSKTSSKNDDVIVLNDANFEAVVAKGGADEVWLVEVYAPWCGHCKALAPIWNEVATELKGKVKVAKIDVTENQMIADHFSIKGFPSIMLFPAGGDRSWNKLPTLAIHYVEHRSKSDIVKFAMSYAGQSRKIAQVISQQQFDAECSTGLCIIAFVPHILDFGAAARNATLQVINEVIPAVMQLPVKFFWSEGGSQFELEEKLHLAFGFPAVVALNREKGKYATHRGPFITTSLRSFVTGLMAGKVSVDDLPVPFPRLHTVTAWDGKDGSLELENGESEL